MRSFDEALADLEVEETLHPDRMIVTHEIVGLGEVKSAHDESLVRSAEAERAACARLAESMDKSAHPSDVADAIRARGTRPPQWEWAEALRVALTYHPEARVLGNVKARDLVAALREAVAR